MHELSKNVYIHVHVYAVSRTSLLTRPRGYCGILDLYEHRGRESMERTDCEYTQALSYNAAATFASTSVTGECCKPISKADGSTVNQRCGGQYGQ